MDIFLISLENWAKCRIVFLKGAFAHFLRIISTLKFGKSFVVGDLELVWMG